MKAINVKMLRHLLEYRPDIIKNLLDEVEHDLEKGWSVQYAFGARGFKNAALVLLKEQSFRAQDLLQKYKRSRTGFVTIAVEKLNAARDEVQDQSLE